MLTGTYITPQIPTTTLPAQVRLQSQKTTPPNTSIKIEYGFGATTPTTWTEATDLITISGDYLWLKYTLETTDTSVTPTLSAVWLEAVDAPQDILKITVDQFARFNNVEGQLKLTYNSALGTLVGVGGAVQSFEHYFMPTDLHREINPNDEETIRTVISDVTLNYDLISYEHAYHDHTINAVASVVVEYTDVTIVNP